MMQNVRGMRDVFGAELEILTTIEQTFAQVCKRFLYAEFRTPMLEHSELFERGVGSSTDIVGKEMYSFQDRGGEHLTLRPEMTAPIVRAAIQHSLLHHKPTTKLWYNAALFRYERPQKGRYRQFQQLGAECLGSPHPEADCEVIALAVTALRLLDIPYILQINTLGTQASRQAYTETLATHLAAFELSEDSQKRLHKNPLRILDSKHPADQPAISSAPQLAQYLDDESQAHFSAVCGLLTAVDIPFVVQPRLVRGLDYYNHTVFEFTTNALGSQDALGGGGRYDPLFHMIGGQATPAVGFSFGADRLLLMKQQGAEGAAAMPLQIAVIAEPEYRMQALILCQQLRSGGASVHIDLQRKSVKAQQKDIQKTAPECVVTVGQTIEVHHNNVSRTVSVAELLGFCKEQRWM
jgi:histidyl-tRNA synthetase